MSPKSILHNIELIYTDDYWILYLILQIPMLFLLYNLSTVITLFFFSKSDHYIYIEFSFKQLVFHPIYIAEKFAPLNAAVKSSELV